MQTLQRMGHDKVTVHGFRSSFRDWCAERTNYPHELAEMALAHAVGDKTEAAYRRGDMFDKRRQLMDAWAISVRWLHRLARSCRSMANIRKIALDCLANEPDKYARQVLQRIAASRDAQAALNAVSKNEDQVWGLIQICINAETRMRTFSETLLAEHETKEQLQRHRKSVSDLRQFIKRATQWREYLFVMPLSETELERVDRQQRLFKRGEGPDAYEKTAEYYRDALNRIELLIDKRQELIEYTMQEFGVTRKSKARRAAENSGIGFLANRVATLMGKPQALHVAALAEAVLGISEVTENRVREAAKMLRRILVRSTNK